MLENIFTPFSFLHPMEGDQYRPSTISEAPKTAAEDLSPRQWLKKMGARVRQQIRNLAFPEETRGRFHFLDTTILSLEDGNFDPQIRSWWQTIGKPAISGHARRVVFEDFGLLVEFTVTEIREISGSSDPIKAIRQKIIDKLSEGRY